ncbi:hypothetical protein Trydic_g7993 [Trypoxylus dichotomus]
MEVERRVITTKVALSEVKNQDNAFCDLKAIVHNEFDPEDSAYLNEVHQAENHRGPHVTGDVDIPPNSDSANSDIPIIKTEDNETRQIILITKKTPETSLDAILPVPSASTVQSTHARSKQLATIFTSPRHLIKRKEVQQKIAERAEHKESAQNKKIQSKCSRKEKRNHMQEENKV